MSKQEIVERILSDAQAEAHTLVGEAESKAAKLLAEASVRAEVMRKEAEAESEEKRRVILEKRAADARLDSAKLLLAEKRKVVDAVYDEALSRLLELSKEDTLRLAERLLTTYAEKGDEIVFARNFRYVSEVEILPIVKEKGLKLAPESAEIDGGFRLKGTVSDKDLSYGALLAADRERYQAELAREIFK